jgi:hypothetical protein
MLISIERLFAMSKVSPNRVVQLLSNDGIRVNKEKAEIILDLLYLLAKTFRQTDDVAIRK